MNVLVINSISKSSLKFEFGEDTVADESMKDYSKMAILLALQEYPDDNPEQCRFIRKKFENQYGGIWICCKYKIGLGGISYRYYNNSLIILYGDFKFLIFKMGNEE